MRRRKKNLTEYPLSLSKERKKRSCQRRQEKKLSILSALQQTNKKLQRIKRLRHFAIVLFLTILLGLLLATTIEYGCKLVKKPPDENTTKSWNFNSTNSQTIRPIRAFFTCVWIFNGFLFLSCLIVHIYSSQRRSRHTRSITIFFR